MTRQTIAEWRSEHWGQPGSCGHCGDPVILADTESWQLKLCFECWENAGSPVTEPRRTSFQFPWVENPFITDKPQEDASLKGIPLKRNERRRQRKDLELVERAILGWTLRPCQPCDGQGFKEHPQPGHRPVKMRCRFCKGSGQRWFDPNGRGATSLVSFQRGLRK